MGGTERVTCSLANEMARHGNDVSIVSVFGVGKQCKFKLDDRVKFVISCEQEYGLQMSKAQRLLMAFRMSRNLRNDEMLCKADVIIAQKFFAAMLAVSAGFRKKLIIGEHYPYKMYSHPVIDFRNMIYRKARVVVVLTDGCRTDFQRNDVKNVHAIGNMVTIARPEAECERVKIVLAVGRLAAEKGFDTLINAFADIANRLADWQLVICGEGDERRNLEQLISERRMGGRIVLKGQVTDVATEYRKASFGVVSSHYEGFSMAILEAAAMGLPMVSFDCPDGPRSILGEGGGLLVEDQNVDALEKAMVKMAEDNNLRGRYIEELTKIVEKYSPENIYNQWMQVIEKYL